MATNTYKIPSSTQHKEGFFSWVDRMLSMDSSVAQVIHVRFLPQIFFISTLCIIYIGNRHYAEKKIRNISQLETQVADLRADYTTLKAAYKFSSKQSEVAKQAASLGLLESDVPPYKVIHREE
ncbi:FtsL-like putative cell division protein [Marinoscillum sp. MHG1-6]|uniref:FtsL-like putative cell division protein n=1 Tax=Marinoscillum sp. MHG1-6 TaxID=2959627 RepID=UPI0021576F85|nr:FtsL-like putative cell division protein [Marinoscillum sp. MHG1-6]